MLLGFLAFVSVFAPVQAGAVAPAPDATCIVSALNRNATMNGDYYVIPGVPAQLGNYRVRALCSDGTVGQTDLVTPVPFTGAAITAGPIVWGYVTPIPQSLTMDAPANMNYGQSVQLATKAVALDASVSDVTSASQGTHYAVSIPWLTSVSPDGLLTVFPQPWWWGNYATQVVVSATNEGTPMARLINIGPRAPINGKVTMADGVTAAAGVQVSLQLNAPLTRLPVLTTDASGNFTLANAAAGDYTVSVIDPVTGNRGSRTSTLAANGQGVFDVKLVGQGNINITVLGSGDLPVAGAQIVLSSGQFSGVVKTIQTDVNGVAAISRFLAGNFNLSVSDAATGGMATASGSLAANGVVSLTVKLQPVGIISGTVLAADGVTPQAGMQVRLLSASKGIVSSGISGLDGKFRFDSLPLADGPYSLLAVAAGSIQGSVGNLVLTYPNQELQQYILLGTFASGGVVSGKVSNQNNAPQTNFAVILTASNGQQQTAQTDALGNYQIYSVPLGNFTVTSGVTGYQGSASGTVHTDGEQITANITVQPYGLIKGVVLLSTGQPAANTNIVFHSGMNSVRQLTTDGSGNFVVDNAPVGIYSIDANEPVTGERGFVNGMLTSPNEEQQHQLTLTAVSKLRVLVTNGGAPVANARVNLALQGLIPYGAELYTDVNGIVEFAAVPKSAYSLAVLSTANGTKSGRATGILKQATESVTVAINTDYLAPFTVYGQVLDTKAMPVANQWVRLSSRKNYLGLIPPYPISNWDEYLVKTDESGNFTFQNVLVHDGGRGDLLLDALVYGQLAGRVDMTTPASGQVVNQDIALFTAGKVLGLVKNATSKPVSGIPIVLTHQSNALYAADDFVTQTDAQGRYALQFVPMGGFTVAVSDGAGGNLASTQAALQQEGQSLTLNFDLSNVLTLKGTVSAYDGSALLPASRITLSLFDQGGQLIKSFQTDPQSNFAAWLNLVSGMQYQLKGVATHPQGMPLTGSSVFTVQAGQDVVVNNITFEETGAITGSLKLESGTAIPNYTFQLINSNGAIYRQATTDQTGVFNFSEVASGSYTIKAQYGKFAFEEILSVSTGQTVVKDVVVPAGTVQGNLTNSSGLALPYHYVYLADVDGKNQRYAYTDATGYFQFQGVVTGDSVLSLTEGAYQASQTVTVTDNATVTSNLIVPVGRIIGKLTYQGGVAAYGIGLSVRTKNGQYYSWITTGAQGDLSLADLPIGLYDIFDGLGNSVALNVSVTSGADLLVNWSLSSTPPLIIKAKRSNGTPVANATVYGYYGNYPMSLGVTNSDGLIAVNANYCPYYSKYSASYPGNANITVTTTTPPPSCNQSQTLELQFKAVAYVKLQVTQNGNAPMAGAQVLGINWNSQIQVLLGATDASGMLNLGELAEGTYTLQIKTSQGESQQVSLVVDAASDGTTVIKSVDFATRFEQFGKLSFNGEKHLYSVAVKQGDKLAIIVHGAVVDGMAANYLVNADIYSPDTTLKASGYGYGSAFNYGQYSSIGDLSNTTIDTDGNYVIAIKPYYTDYFGGYFLSASVNGQAVEIKPYQGGGTVQGTVYQVDGVTPLANEMVDISTSDVLGLHLRTTSDASGHYQFDNVPLTDLTVSLVEAGQILVSATDKLVTPAQVIVQDMKVPQRTTLQVSITVPNDAVIPYLMTFSVTDVNGTRNVGPVLFGGNYTSTSFTTVALGDTITVSAIHPSNANINVTQIVNGADGQTIPVNLVLDSAKVSGTVFKADGTPSTYIPVNVYQASNQAYVTTAMTDSQGMYILTALPVGQDLIISAQNPGNYLGSTLTVNLTSQQNLTGQDIHLMPTGSVTGLVKYSTGVVVPNANVAVTGTFNGNTFNMSGVTDSNGQFQIDNIPVGATVQVSATQPGLGGTQQQSAVIDTPNQLLALPDFTFVVGATLQLNVVDGNHKVRPELMYSIECGANVLAITSSQGVTEMRVNNLVPLTGVPVGPVNVKFYDACSRQTLATASINITSSQSYVLDVVVPLVEVNVSLQGGFPARYPGVSIYQGPQAFWSLYGTSLKNKFVFAGVQPGAFSVSAGDYYSGSLAQVNVMGTMPDVGNTSMDVVLPYDYSLFASYLGAAVVGSVKLTDGTPAAGLDVTLFQSQSGTTWYTQTDVSGLYLFDSVPPGPFEITVQDTTTGLSASTTGNVLPNVANHADLVMPPTGTVTGTLYDSNFNPIPFADVYVNSTGFPGVYFHTITDVNGVYRLDHVALGSITVTGYDPVAQVDLTATGTLSTDQQTITLDMNEGTGAYSGPGMISGTVRYSDGTPVGGAEIALSQTGPAQFATTDGTGYYQFTLPTIGAFNMTALDPVSGLSTNANGNVTASAINTVDLAMPSSGSVSGVVYDGNNYPLPNSSLIVTSSGMPGISLNVTTDAQGKYHVDHIALGDIKVADSSNLLVGTGSLTTDQQSITVDLHAIYAGPGIILGKVKFSDGTPVVNADVSLTQAGLTTWVSTDAAGVYQFTALSFGVVYDISAYDINSSLWVTVNGTAIAGVVNTVDIVLPPAGIVTGTLYDNNNQPIPNADVYVDTTGMPGFDIYGRTDVNGVYRISQVPVGAITVAGYDLTTQMAASGTGTLNNNLDVITVDLHETASGIVTGHVMADSLGTPVPNANVTLVTSRSYGPFWPIQQSVVADAAGAFSFGTAPPGGFRLYASDPANTTVVGFSDGAAVMNAVTNVDITLGNGTSLPYTLAGADGYQYQVSCNGTLVIGNYANYGYWLTINNNSYFPCLPGAGLSSDKTELTFGPAMMETVQVTRRVFSPAAGGFVRFIDTYTNPGIADVAVGIQVSVDQGQYSPLLVDPINNGQTYAVLDNPAMAHVFGGVGGVPNFGDTFRYQAYSSVDSLGVLSYYYSTFSYNWTLSVPAGKSVSLMHYSAQAASSLVAQAIATALSTNAAPYMFDGIAPIDKPSFYNFVVP